MCPYRCPRCAYHTVTSDWFEGIIHCIVLLNVIPIAWETVYIVDDTHLSFSAVLAFLITNVVFTGIYCLEFTLKVVGLGCGNYWSSKWNMLDALILVISLIEVVLSFTYLNLSEKTNATTKTASDIEFLKLLRFLRLLRITRIFRLFHVIQL